MRGGVRSGAGRPKSEDSAVVRVPAGCLDAVKALIECYKQTGSIPVPASQPDTEITSELVRLRSQVEHYRRESELCQSERNEAFKVARAFEDRLLAADISNRLGIPKCPI